MTEQPTRPRPALAFARASPWSGAAASAPPSPPRCATPATRSTGPPAAASAPARRRGAALRARRRDPRGGRGGRRRGPARRPHQRRHAAGRPRPRRRRGLRAPSAPDVPGASRTRPGPLRGRRLCRGRLHDGGARPPPRSWPARSGMRPFEIDDARPRRLPRRRLDRLQLPRDARGGRRARSPRGAGLEPRQARELLAPLVRTHRGELGRARARAGAHRPRGPRRRAPRWRRQRGAVAERAPELLAALRRAGASAPAALAAGR